MVLTVVCVILAELLQRAGHRVTLVGARFSSPVLQRFAAFRVPEPYGWTTAGIERVTLRWFDRHRYFLERYLPPIDVCIVGSFPFITAIPYLRQLGSEVVFLDFGVVPTTGYPRRLRWLVQGVAKVRRRHLRHANTIVAISDFIARSQSERDGAGRTRVATALLGADHLARGLGNANRPSSRTSATSPVETAIRAARERDRRLLLLLGRFEPGCYKNSQAALDVIRRLRSSQPNATLLVMAKAADLPRDPDLGDGVLGIGYPSDEELARVIEAIDAGISVSLWEGFNLPIAEFAVRGQTGLRF